jgi:hypothetical protein
VSFELIVSFGVWLGFGIYLRQKQKLMLQWISQFSKFRRMLLGSIGLLLMGALLLLGMVLIADFGGYQNGKMQLWGWLFITLLGCSFVFVQVMSALSILTIVLPKKGS